jgi:hypothetical protein
LEWSDNSSAIRLCLVHVLRVLEMASIFLVFLGSSDLVHPPWWLQDEFYYRYIVKHNCFEPVIAAFLANGNRYNLLNSAVLELIDFIRREGIKSLIAHLVEKFSSQLEGIDYADTFQALKLKYEQVKKDPCVIIIIPDPKTVNFKPGPSTKK